jgi:hypothetical protein
MMRRRLATAVFLVNLLISVYSQCTPLCDAGSTCTFSIFGYDCTTCPAGEYTSAPGSVGYFCDFCSPGKFNNASGLTTCYQCPAGRFEPSLGSSSCNKIEAGMSCPAGSTSNSTCFNCPSGRYSLGGTPCLNCSGGLFSATQKSTSCSVCPIGTFSSAGVSACTKCSAGFYGNSTGLSTCFACDLGLFSAAQGASTCAQCRIGLFGDSSVAVRSRCSNCSAGFYSDSLGATTCVQCAAGKFSSVQAASTCMQCPTGSFQNSLSVIPSRCFNCSAGFYSDMLGASTCSQCAAGKFSSATGVSVCITCPINSMAISAQTYCMACSPGTSTAKLKGASACLNCSVGLYSSLPGQDCVPCPIGSYSSVSGMSNCTKCIDSTTRSTGSISSDQCSLCNEGLYGSPPQPCQKCPQNAGVKCPFGSVIPFVLEGYYRDNSNPEIAYICSPSSSCMETGFEKSTPCFTGYTGRLCGDCVSGYYRIDENCQKCPNVIIKVFTILGITLIVSVVLFRTIFSTLSLSNDARILLQSLQILALYPEITVRWPPSILAVLQTLAISVSFIVCNISLNL